MNAPENSVRAKVRRLAKQMLDSTNMVELYLLGERAVENDLWKFVSGVYEARKSELRYVTNYKELQLVLKKARTVGLPVTVKLNSGKEELLEEYKKVFKY